MTAVALVVSGAFVLAAGLLLAAAIAQAVWGDWQ